MKVYVVTSGEYSDYCIDAVFIEKEQAEIYCATKNDSNYYDCRIEEFDTDDFRIESKTVPKERYKARITRKGRDLYIYEKLFTFKEINSVSSWQDGSYNVVVTLDKDIPEEQVKKIIYDRLAKWKAEQMEGGVENE